MTAAISEKWIKGYVDQLLEAAGKFAEGPMRDAALVRADNVMDMVKAFRETVSGPNYKDYPESVTEVTADKSQNAMDWSPRDALISALRDLDSGEINPSILLVGCAKVTKNGGILPNFYLSSTNSLMSQGLLKTIERQMGKSIDEL
jgi:hypothetical protein